MLLKVNTLSLGVDQVLLQLGIETLWAGTGQPYAQRKTLHASGYLLTTVPSGTDAQRQADLTLLENALKTALATPYPNIVFYQSDNVTPSSETLLNAGSTTGVCVTHLAFPESRGPEYATIRSYEFVATAEYPLPNTANLILEFRESLSFGGGGPLFIHRPSINTVWQKQLVYPKLPFTCRQSGSLVAYRTQKTPPPPRFPAALVRPGDVTYGSPDRRRVGSYTGYVTEWQYEFMSTGPFGQTAPRLV